MIDKLRSSAKQTIFYGIGNVSVKFVGLLLLPVYSSYFPIELYGLLALFEISSEILLAISSVGIESGFNRYYWDKEYLDKQKSYFFSVLAFSIVSALLFLAGAYWVILNYSEGIFNAEIGQQLAIIYLVNVFLKVVVNRSILLMQIQQKVKKQTVFVIANVFTVLITTIIFIIHFKMKLEGVFLGQICGNGLVVILLLPYLWRQIEFRLDIKILKELLRFSLPIAVSNIMTIVMTLSDRFILKHFYDLGDVGQYSLAYKVANIIKLFLVRSFTKSYSFKYYKEISKPQDNLFFSKSITYFSFVAVYSGLVLSIFGGLIIKLFTDNPDYYNSLAIVPYLIVGIILFGIRSMLTLPLAKLEKTKLIAIIAVSTGGLNILLNLLLIPSSGAIGAALATAISQGAALSACLLINKKFGIMHYEVVKYGKAFIIGVLLIYIWLKLPRINLFFELLFDLFILILYPVLLKMMRFFDEEELTRIKQSISKWMRWENISNLIKKKSGE